MPPKRSAVSKMGSSVQRSSRSIQDGTSQASIKRLGLVERFDSSETLTATPRRAKKIPKLSNAKDVTANSVAKQPKHNSKGNSKSSNLKDKKATSNRFTESIDQYRSEPREITETKDEDQNQGQSEDVLSSKKGKLKGTHTESSNEYVLKHMLRAHSRSTHDGHEDDSVDIWAVAFEPTLSSIRTHVQDLNQVERSAGKGQKECNKGAEDEYKHDDGGIQRRRKLEQKQHISKDGASYLKKSSSLVATCGGNTVCLIDCSLGRIIAKYSHLEEEEFMCLAWTTLASSFDEGGGEGGLDWSTFTQEYRSGLSDRHDVTNILAVAGRMGSIKLINPLQGICYKYLHGHTASILRLKFSLTNPRWLFSASVDGTARLWDIGSPHNFEKEARCLAKFDGMDGSSVTAIGVSEKYLIFGTEKGLMAQYNLFKLAKEVNKNLESGKKSLYNATPQKIYPPSQEWHESSVDEIIYIPHFSSESYALKADLGAIEINNKSAMANKKSHNGSSSSHGQGRARGRIRNQGRTKPSGNEGIEGKNDEKDKTQDESEQDENDGEFVFASRENSQGEILIWEATKSTATDAELKTILEWSITESWTKFTLAENMIAVPSTVATTSSKKKRAKSNNLTEMRQNILVAGSTDGKVLVYDLARKPKRARDGNIIAEKPSGTLSHPDSNELFRDTAVSQDLSTIVTVDWSNRVLVWKYQETTAS
ncbi:Leucine-rich repeats and WD repeat domain-containing protein 1 [Lobosporangium transversale]|uniref:WD40-repeat-containing domain protein n=1 Tax=Lobosporangium transversale TaxID=64571 RepID=A0A1Y2GSZ4_9FUNG|nr:WD40-repeat-containing domain protein [Lobosporangium transversale]KAF9914526.1 Leucine-rich repeats and WD repeat domain-containing protein 1 [Lobosporangium transversale]ORZ21910.1 WD40-repeat-containing domain protein [Lobosporangium transversale]|eukprot:XP_021883161.1 WD40-repeat-containing domain protein [Lobosporangium transversale]